MYGSSDGNNLGVGGRYSQTNALGIHRVPGGINLMGNPDYRFDGVGDNAVYHIDDTGLFLEPLLNIHTLSVSPCKVIYVDPPAVPIKRDYNPNDPENWAVEDVELLDNWMELGTTVLLDDPSALESAVLGHLGGLAGSESSIGNTENYQADATEPEESSRERTSKQGHLRRHGHGSLYGHVH